MRNPDGNVNTGQMLVFVPPHPLINHWLAIARNSACSRRAPRSRRDPHPLLVPLPLPQPPPRLQATPPPVFRAALAELGRILIYEATPPRPAPPPSQRRGERALTLSSAGVP